MNEVRHTLSHLTLNRMFLPIATSRGVTINAPANCFVSFTNSPYYSHQHTSAVDIYASQNNLANSPIDGKVLDSITVRSPRSKYFQADEEEQLLLIRASENPKLIVRILHTNYSPPKGTRLTVGSPMGHILRSGFYDFWTEYHIHVEVRNPTNLLRAKGGLHITPLTKSSKLLGTSCLKPPRLRVVESNENFTLVRPVDGTATLGHFRGLACRVGEITGILDAGIPHYLAGSVQLEPDITPRIGSEVSLWGTSIGTVTESTNGLGVFRTLPIELRVNGKLIRGLSFYPWVLRPPLLKLIPQRPSPERWRVDEEVTVHLDRIASPYEL